MNAPPKDDRILPVTRIVAAIGAREPRLLDAVFECCGEQEALDQGIALLKPGGKLGIVQHMADPEQDWLSRNIGYVTRDYIVSKAVQAGFVLEAEGFFNRNPLDTKRHAGGVWQLPPNLRRLETEEEKAAYRAVGESSRMTLVFVKPDSQP